LNEGFGLPPLESMACGTPVVTSHVTATGEFCEGAAMMVEPAEVDDIYGATHKLLTEKEIYDELVDLGRERAAQYTWKNCAIKTEQAYRGVVTQNSPNEGRLYSSL
jgi:glycosyltransferase involved in cell wall biosynthesis